MADSSLFSTGIVREGRNDDYRCHLCPEEVILRSQDLPGHLENNQHVSLIGRFHLIFVINRDSIDCKACNASVDWKGFKNHAEWHRIVPWYEIIDEDKTFFENRLLNVHSTFICVLCKKSFKNRTGAFAHIGEEQHRKLIAFEPPIHETFTPTDSSYGFLISEGFEPSGSNTVKCRPCLSSNVRLNNLQEHISQPDHVRAKVCFVADTSDLADVSRGCKIDRNFVTKTNRNPAKHDTTSAIEKLVVGLCTGAFSDIDKNSHLHDQHRSSSNSRMSNSGFRNKNSNHQDRHFHQSNWTSRSHNKDSDCQGKHSHHRDSTSWQKSSLDPPHSKPQNKNFIPRNETTNSGNGQPKLCDNKSTLHRVRHDWPVETREDCRWCTICNEVIQCTSDLHIAEERHTCNLKRLGREYVVTKNGREFWCNCCNVKVPNLENVFRHIKGGKHRQNIPAAESMGAREVKAQEEAKSKGKEKQEVETRVEKEKGKVTSFKMDFSEASQPPAMNLASLMPPNQYPLLPLNYNTGGVIPPFGIPVIPSGGSLGVQSMMQVPITLNNPPHPYLPLAVNKAPCPVMDSKFTPERLPRDYIIIHNSDDLVCRLCDLIIHGNGKVDEHIEHENHCRMVEDFCATIVSCGENNYHCNRCNATVNSRNDLYIHLSQNSHRGNRGLMNNSQNLNSQESSLGSSKLNVQEKSLTAAGNFSRGYPGHDFIVILGRFDFCCKICHVLLQDQTRIETHLQEPEHQTAFRRYERTKIINDGKYDCKNCKCSIPNFANVPLHVFGVQHGAKSPESSSNCSSGSGDLELNFIVQIGEEDYYCVICNVTIITKRHLDQHLQDEMHVGSREKYDCEQIIATKDGSKNLRCKCCDCTILKFNCVFVHLAGQRHIQNVAAKRQEQSQRKDNEASVVKEEAPKPVEKIVDEEIKRRSEVVSPEAGPSVSEVSSKKEEGRSASKQARINAEDFVGMMEDEMNGDLSRHSKIEKQMKRLTVDEESLAPRSLASSTMSLNTAGKKLRAPRVNKPQIAAPIAIDVFDMRDKLREFDKDAKLCAPVYDASSNIITDLYCMICSDYIGGKWKLYKHLWSHDHCDNLVSKKIAHKEFELIEDQFSDWDLAQEYLEEKSEKMIYCWACVETIKNSDEVIRAHMACESHIEQRAGLRSGTLSKIANEGASGIRCDWCDIQEFHCTLCNSTYDSEFQFVEHIQGPAHAVAAKEIDSTIRPLIYDFCATCSILWYGERSQFAIHAETRRHSSRLAEQSEPEIHKLHRNLGEIILDICANGIEEMSADPYLPRRQFIADLEASVQQNFPGSKARVIGANPLSTDSGKFEVFLDFGIPFNGISEDSLRFLAQRVASALSDHPAKWYMALTNDKNMPIKVTTRHLPSKSTVEIFLDDKLVLTESKFFNSLRGASIYLDWPIRTVKSCMTLYENEFHESMLPYIEDTMVFFMQSKSLLPKVSDLVSFETRPLFKPGKLNLLSNIDGDNEVSDLVSFETRPLFKPGKLNLLSNIDGDNEKFKITVLKWKGRMTLNFGGFLLSRIYICTKILGSRSEWPEDVEKIFRRAMAFD